MLSRCYAPALDHAQTTELRIQGCGYAVTPDLT